MTNLRPIAIGLIAAFAALAQTAVYPGQVVTDQQLKVARDRAQTTLNVALNASATSFTVVSAAKFAANLIVTIDSEQISICGVSGNTVSVGHSTCPNIDGRGFGGTAAASHANGALVSAYMTAWNYNAQDAELKAVETALGANLANIVALIPNPTPVANGGTGSTTAATARTALGAAASGANADITSLTGLSTPLPVNEGGTAATTAAGARTALGAAASGANADITSITGLSTPLPVNEGGTGAATLTGVVIGAGTSPATAVAGTALQRLRRKPNVSTTTYEFSAPVTADAVDYDFPAQTPGGTLAAGSNTITLTPCPLGVNGSDSAHYLYITGGTGSGSAERVPITGGTCTSGATTGTAIVTVAACGGGTCHSGAWTIVSATGGLAEAAAAFPTGALIRVSATITAHAPLTIASGAFTLTGTSRSIYQIARASDFADDHLLKVTSSGSLTLVNLGVNAADSTGHYASVACYDGGNFFAESTLINSGYYGVLSDSCSTTFLHRADYLNGNVAGDKANAGVKLDCTHAGAENNVSISDSAITMYGSPAGTNGIDAFCVDGLQLQNVGIAAQRPLIFEPSGSKYIGNVGISNLQADNFTDTGIVFAGTSSSFYTNVNISGGWINCENASGSVGIDIGFNHGPINAQAIQVTGAQISLCPYGIVYGRMTAGSTGRTVAIKGNTIIGADAGTGTGILMNNSSGTSYNLTVSGNSIFNAARAIDVQTAFQSVDITANNLCGSTLPIGLFSTLTGVVANNACVDNPVVTLASAATLALPINSAFNLTGGTGATAITFAGPAPFTWRFTVGASTTFTAGSSIGNTITIAKWGTIFWDGTKAWIQGI